MKTIRIAFSNYFLNFKKKKSAIAELLSKVYNVEIVDFREKPDILFFSLFGYDEHFKCRDAVKVYVTQENDVPNFNICEYGVSFHDIRFGDRSFPTDSPITAIITWPSPTFGKGKG